MILESLAATSRGAGCRIMDCYAVNWCVRGCRNSLWREPMIENRAVVRRDPGKCDRLVKNGRDALAWNGMAARIVVTEIADVDERKAFCAEIKIGERADMPAMK